MRVGVWLPALVFASAATMAADNGPPPEQAPAPAEVAKGATLFAQICAHCHGPHMVNPGNASFDLRKFPHNDRARFFNSVMNGKNSMPPWRDVLKPDEIEAIWAYVRTGGHTD
jgi:mono/diheme cytochrome c family protein